ncbi:MAG: B12-binding domain-containing radical SAM protein, partial [Candidatus Thermoplasmatota archaeon]|nr:B12-binding domain-containing radical SAM protein [Candidatus Thermoplasmatota archaeon]
GRKVLKPVSVYTDVNALPFPDRELFPMEKYFATRGRHGKEYSEETRSASLLTSRGCPYRCNFCSASDVFGKKIRNRTPESVITEIDELVSVYGVNDIYLSDDQFLANRDRVIAILDLIITRNYGVTFDAPNGMSPWLLDEEIIIKMKKAGFYQIHLAVESGNEWVLKNIVNKPVKLDKLPEVVELGRKHGLAVSAFLVVGNVGETAIETFEQMEDSFKLMRDLGIRHPTVSFLSPHVGSVAYDVVCRKGYIDETYLDNEYNRPVIETPLWTKAELERFVTIQYMLCVIHGKRLFWPIKVFAQEWGGVLKRRRHQLLFNIITGYRAIKALAEGR